MLFFFGEVTVKNDFKCSSEGLSSILKSKKAVIAVWRKCLFDELCLRHEFLCCWP